MSGLPHAASAAPPAASHTSSPVALPRYRAERLDSLDSFIARCTALLDGDPHALPFHHPHWVRAWYETLGHDEGAEPLMLAVQRLAADGRARDALLLPLVLRRRRGRLGLALRQAEYADAGVVDYTAPLVAADWAGGAAAAPAAAALWQALRGALRQVPGGCDLLALDKMLPAPLAEHSGRGNPLALALPVVASELTGNHFSVDGDWEQWRRSLDKRVRKEIERCWRVFHRSDEARFEHITDPHEARALLHQLEQQQSERLVPALGAAYRLDRPAHRDFYRRLLEAGLADGPVVLTALRDGPHLVSALFGVANGARYIALRQSIGGDAWRTCSPGRLLDEQTARHMHGLGRRHFDFGIGTYFHKTTLRMERTPLVDARCALGWRGQLAVGAWHLKRWLKGQAWLMSRWQRFKRGRAPGVGGGTPGDAAPPDDQNPATTAPPGGAPREPTT